MTKYPSVAATFEALQLLDAQVSKNSHDIDLWCIYLKRSKANQQAVLLMLITRQINEKLMKRLWLAEREAIDARREARIARHEVQEWQFTALSVVDPDSQLLH
jgi:hypothetical protein